MIKSFRDKATSDLFHGNSSSKVRKLPTQILDSAIYKLDILNAATTLDDLRSHPGNRLEVLRGDYEGYHSIRINAQWRIIFRWQDSSAYDVAIIDTAGRLHNKKSLMNELTKIKKVMQKVVSGAPDEILLILDASTGQNAILQAKEFTSATEVNALALTKLDGTAKGGVAIGISDQFKIPVKYIGIGEKMEDLELFDKKAFVESLFNRPQ
jgi:plasmid maintenance system killer protein